MKRGHIKQLGAALLAGLLFFTGCVKQSAEKFEFDFNRVDEEFSTQAKTGVYDEKSQSIFYKTLKRDSKSDSKFKKIDTKKNSDGNTFFHMRGEELYFVAEEHFNEEHEDTAYTHYTIRKYNTRTKAPTDLVTGRDLVADIKTQPSALDFLDESGKGIEITAEAVYDHYIVFYATVQFVSTEDEEDSDKYSWSNQSEETQNRSAFTVTNDKAEFDQKDFLFVYDINTGENHLVPSYGQNETYAMNYSGAVYQGEFYYNGPHTFNVKKGLWEPASLYKYNFETQRETLYKKGVCDPFVFEGRLGYAKTTDRGTVTTEDSAYTFYKIDEYADSELEEGEVNEECWVFSGDVGQNHISAHSWFSRDSITKLTEGNPTIAKFAIPKYPKHSGAQGTGVYAKGKFQPLILSPRFAYCVYSDDNLVYMVNSNDSSTQLLLFDPTDPSCIRELYFEKFKESTDYSYQFFRDGDTLTVVASKYVDIVMCEGGTWEGDYITTIKL